MKHCYGIWWYTTRENHITTRDGTSLTTSSPQRTVRASSPAYGSIPLSFFMRRTGLIYGFYHPVGFKELRQLQLKPRICGSSRNVCTPFWNVMWRSFPSFFLPCYDLLTVYFHLIKFFRFNSFAETTLTHNVGFNKYIVELFLCSESWNLDDLPKKFQARPLNLLLK